MHRLEGNVVSLCCRTRHVGPVPSIDCCPLLRGGFFSVALARNFRKCIIADSSRELVQLARRNLELNEIRNVQALWMTAVSMLESWKSNSLPGLVSPNTLLVDPTRHGLDSAVTEILPAFENILYISCNPRTMARDLRTTTMTHDVKEFACFDQFPGTDHMECAALLTRRKGTAHVGLLSELRSSS